MKDLTVVVITYRRPELLRRSLEGYRRLDCGDLRWKLVLVDNAGDADTRELAAEFGEVLPLEFLVEARRGQNIARNVGLEAAEGELYVFSDDDTIPAPDWLEEIWAGVCRWPDATMFTGKIFPLWPGGHQAVELRTDLLRSAYMESAWGEEEGYISPDRMWGPNLAIRAAPFLRGHRFDTSIGPSAGQYAMGSELEMALRLSREGHTGVYLPRAVVHHQIRPEQLKERWLVGRAYRSGRGVVRLQGVPSSPRVFGLPRFVFREIATHGSRWATGWLEGDRELRLDGKLDFFHWQGKLREYWRVRDGGGG
jgi:glucosyl-dolichyl phosphate glucuronosyltransferase